MTEKRVKDYYTGYVRQEWRRLIQDAYHRLEYDTTFHFLEKYLPKKGRILDAGGGPGRYTLELAKRGYEVVLLDMTRANLEFARRQIKRGKVQDKVGQVIEGSIVDLSQFADNTFDAVVCLGGPLSHVLDQLDRQMAIKELIRVAKQGAPIFVSVMGKLSILVVELALFPHELEKSFFKPMRDGGDYNGRSGFTACHFFLPEELVNAFQSQGLIVLEMVGLEGLGSHHDRKVNELAKNKKRWRIWMETHYQTCTHPSVVGISEHMLLIGKKRRIET
jgi:SAM-dependent methyltransferase